MAKDKKDKKRKFRGWYTHEFFELSLTKLQKLSKQWGGLEFADPENPTLEEIAKVYEVAFAEMDDPWEVTANGVCKVEEITD